MGLFTTLILRCPVDRASKDRSSARHSSFEAPLHFAPEERYLENAVVVSRENAESHQLRLTGTLFTVKTGASLLSE